MLRTVVLPLIATTLLFAGQDLDADPTRDTLFAEAEAARVAAAQADAEKLAPEGFEAGTERLERASDDYQRGRSLDRIRTGLIETTRLFQEAATAAGKAKNDLRGLIEARQAAVTAEAQTLDSDRWRSAEKGFRQSAIYLERGYRDEGLEVAAAATEDYRNAELTAIKAGLLQDTRVLIERARKDRVQKNAPRTLDKAEELLARAETELENNRYDMDLPRELARQANYEARHAIYLSRYISEQKQNKRTTEDTILQLEEPLRRVAASADIVAEFDEGSGPPADQTAAYIEELRERSASLQQDLNERTRQVHALEQEVTDAYDRLGGVAEERRALTREIERQEMERQRLKDVEELFTRDQARVLRQGEDVIIRLVGLNFAVGSAEIPANGNELMVSLQTALRLFPGAGITVAGHTDSFGSDAANFDLSKRRAESVRRHLLANTRIAAARIAAVGYGETQPVASNQTPEGRARNRRIDVVIQPPREQAAR
jgi:outer membrane protein OmpA-like peptidoglycan-associated protein